MRMAHLSSLAAAFIFMILKRKAFCSRLKLLRNKINRKIMVLLIQAHCVCDERIMSDENPQ